MVGQNYLQLTNDLIEESTFGFTTLSCGCRVKLNTDLLKMAQDKWSDLLVAGIPDALEYYHSKILNTH